MVCWPNQGPVFAVCLLACLVVCLVGCFLLEGMGGYSLDVLACLLVLNPESCETEQKRTFENHQTRQLNAFAQSSPSPNLLWHTCNLHSSQTSEGLAPAIFVPSTLETSGPSSLGFQDAIRFCCLVFSWVMTQHELLILYYLSDVFT